MPRPKSITLKDIARRTGASIPVVSAVVNGTRTTAGVSEAMRQRILQVATDLEYTVNANASSLRKGRSGAIGLLTRNLWEPVLVEGLSCATQLCARHEHPLIVACVDQTPDWVHMLRRGQVDLLLILAMDTLAATRIHVPDSLRRRVVVVGPTLRIMDADQRQWGVQVAWDDCHGGRMAAEYLIEKGCRHIGILGGDLPKSMRIEGFHQAMAEHGIEPHIVTRPAPEGDRFIAGSEMTRRLLGEHPQIDGLFLRNDGFAPGVRLAALEAGRTFQGDLHVVGYGGYRPWLPSVVPPMTESIQHVLTSYFKKGVDSLADRTFPLRFADPENDEAAVRNAQPMEPPS